MWTQRHGLEPDAANIQFSYLLIPGVGLAPVTAFRVLITVFVLVVGPLNFWVLRRRGRAHLMVLTVPITSLVLTASLFAYALAADGFGVRVRARSVAWLDQTRGEQTVWSRNCYYAAIAPSDGLTFSDDTAVYPILGGLDDPTTTAVRLRERAVTWGAGDTETSEQGLTTGWLPPRESTQLLTVTSTPTTARIDIDADTEQLTATNGLGADLELLIVVDEDRSYWVAESVDESPTELEAVELSKAISAFRSLLSFNEPLPPIGLLEVQDSMLLERQRRRQRRRQQQADQSLEYAPIAVGDNLLNKTLARLAGTDGSDPLMLPPRSFVAVSNKSIGAPIGLDSAVETGSFHVVIGRW